MGFCKDCGTELEMLSVEGAFVPYCMTCKAWIIQDQKTSNIQTTPSLNKTFNIPNWISNFTEQLLKHPAFWTFWIGFIAGELLK